MSDLYLIAVIAGVEVAISSDCIESVVTVSDVVTVPRCDPLVAGLMALRSRVLTLIDCQYAVTGHRRAIAPRHHAVIVDVGGHSYALAVDAVRDVVSVQRDCVHRAARLDARWSALCPEIAEIEDRVIMILSPEMLLAPIPAMAA
jgi:purine-binding chemotaxis protein CheW